MKKQLLTIAATLALGLPAAQLSAGELEWMTDLPKAQAKAKEDKKLVLLDFTGSDWCGWCIKLHKEVFSTPEFEAYAKKNLVMVEVDFPRKKQLSDEQKKANDALKQKYKIQGYPTLILLDGEGKKVAELSFDDGVDKKAPAQKVPVAKPDIFIAAIDKAKPKS